jgi:hypothetical protein
MESDLQVVDPIRWLRRDPHRFFTGGKVEPITLVLAVAADILYAGGELNVRNSSRWWIVGSNVDWLVPNYRGLQATELFKNVVSEPARGAHSMRGEVLLGAFASAVWISLEGNREGVIGTAPDQTAWSRTEDLHRCIFFCM